MKRITIIVSGGQEDSLVKQLAKGAAQLLAENWDAGCSLQVEEVAQKKAEAGPTSREEPFVAKKGLQVMGFMSPGTC